MKKYFLLAFVLLAVLYSDVPAKDVWTQVQSKNFFLVGNASDKEIRRVATTMEQFRQVFGTLLPKMKLNSPVPTTVIVFRSEKAYDPYRPVTDGTKTSWAAGYFRPGEDRNYIVLPATGPTASKMQLIFHEYVHLLIDNTFGKSRIPPWFNEGLAEYYDQFTIENDQKVTLGAPNGNHLYALSQQKLIPLDQLFNTDYRSLNSQGSHSASIFYAQSWALMHYLLQGNEGKRKPQFVRFTDMVLKGAKPADAFRTAFETDYATMEKELRGYIGQRRFNVTEATFKEKLTFETAMQSSPLSEYEAKAHLGDLLFHSGRLAEAEAHLTEALAGDENMPLANATLGMVKMRQNKPAEAKRHLERVVTPDQKSHLVFYRYAYILSREPMGANGFVSKFSDEAAAKMRTALKRAIELDPTFPESYRLLSFINAVRNENIDESIGHMARALALSPGNQEFQYALANLYIRKDDFDKAERIYEDILRTADEPELRQLAERSLAGLKDRRAYMEAAAARSRNRGSAVTVNSESSRVYTYDPDEKPPTEEEIEAMRAKVQHETILENLRVPLAGETRVLGHLSKIECGRGGIVYSAKTPAGPITFRSVDFQKLHLMMFVPMNTADTEIGCETVKRDIFAVMTYVPKPDPRSKTAGELTSIEIVPENFKFE